MTKELLKWGALILVVLLAWRWVSGMISGAVSSIGVPSVGPIQPQWQPNYYVMGVYGPNAAQGDPFYSSPDKLRQRGRWVRPKPM